ncbi:LOW QUALITY PROTEIN: Hypothetical protein PHPALM_9379 [Phytophthora palmivora]|uniref:PiggyBac transposable element-derived protein domain-containing protein n=1 Tax=Phytophthora palmivora TaxID=4796 RepID=A0A2P4Y7F3_9STRA|nr:LOW QUALITY PROTEIN: Hypothetical protein PHPALM_9379 [Phytophthora palmivora]
MYIYSLQLAIKYKKYYKSLFLGLVDLAVINAYIVFNARRAGTGQKKVNHVKFLKQLHLELCQLRDEDWEGLRNITSDRVELAPSKSSFHSQCPEHKRVQNDEWRPGNNQTGRKTRVCKVCSLLKGLDDVQGGDSSIYCSDCKLTTSSKRPKAWRVLCDKPRRKHNGIPITCFDLWHQVWRNGTALPSSARKRKIRARTPAELSANQGEVEAIQPRENLSNGDESDDSAMDQSKRTRTAEPVDSAFVA